MYAANTFGQWKELFNLKQTSFTIVVNNDKLLAMNLITGICTNRLHIACTQMIL